VEPAVLLHNDEVVVEGEAPPRAILFVKSRISLPLPPPTESVGRLVVLVDRGISEQGSVSASESYLWPPPLGFRRSRAIVTNEP
jgi:hypothetical protein